MHAFQRVKHGSVVTSGQSSLVTDTNAYSTNDVVGGLLVLPVSSATGCGVISEIKLVDKKDTPVSGAYTLHVYNTAPTTIADDAAFAITDTEMETRLRKVAIAALDYTAETGVGSFARVSLVDDPIYFQTGTGYLYFYLQAGSTHDYGAANLLSMVVTYLEIV
jgi:hypothetical protein